MYVMKCSEDGEFLAGGLQPFGNIELNPASCVLNYGQVIYSNACTFWASFSAGFIDPFFIQIDLFFFMIKGCHWCFQNFMHSSALADLLCYCCFLIQTNYDAAQNSPMKFLGKQTENKIYLGISTQDCLKLAPSKVRKLLHQSIIAHFYRLLRLNSIPN